MTLFLALLMLPLYTAVVIFWFTLAKSLGEMLLLEGRIYTMSTELDSLKTNVANLNSAITALATRVTALQASAISPADVQAQADVVASAVTAIDAIAPATPPAP